jgi:hypothetical protein
VTTTLQECRSTFKDGGFKAVMRRYGWKIFAAFFAYYLVRDLILYVLVPYLIARHFIA